MNDLSKVQTEIVNIKHIQDVTILAHNYQIPEVQQVADYIGDSFELSKIARQVTSAVIVFCGVYFMAETAKILAPDKTVIIPNKAAGCPLADMATPEQVRDMKQTYPTASIVSYVNSSALVKAESDICCTSSNAVQVVNSLPTDTVIMLPDQNLANYVTKFTNKTVIPWDGFCVSHARVTLDELNETRELHPKAPILVHPECPTDIKEQADYVMGTGGMVKFAKDTDYDKVIIGTEEGLIHRLEREFPEKEYYLLSPSFFCSNMKRITLDNLLASLKELSPEVKVSKETETKAHRALDNMLELSVKR